SNPSISGDGQFIVYESRRSSGIYDIFLADVDNHITTRVNVNLSAGPAIGSSRWPQLSRDARYVVFSSQANDLVDNDTNRNQDIFVRDLIVGTTVLLSQNAQ